MTPTDRQMLLLRLLRERPHGLAELQALLEVSAPTLRRYLDTLRRAGHSLQEQGRPKTVWIP